MDRHTMRPFPPLPDLDDQEGSDDVLEGHLWLLELIDGSGLRFRMDESGLLRFGGPETTYADVDAIPLALRSAVRHVRDRFDREALRRAVDDPAGVTFFGVATHRRGTDYDWDRIPPFLGTDVWVGGGDEADAETADGAFRPPDAVAAIFEGVGLDPVNAVAREVNVRDFDPDRYAVPASAWRAGPAAGVVVRNKRGGRGRIVRGTNDGDPDDAADPDDLATTYAGRERFERIAESLERRGEPTTVDALADRVIEAAARETSLRFATGNSGPDGVDITRFRASVVERARPFLDDRQAGGHGGAGGTE
jgi:hypothetical protein